MQQMAYLHTPLPCYVMWPIHQTCNSVKDYSPFWTISPMQENEDINRSFRNSMPCIYTSWSRFQRPFSCLHNSFFLLMLWGTGKVTLVCMFPCFAACLGYPSIHLKTSVTIYMPLSPMRHLWILSAQLTPVSTSQGRIMTKVNGSIWTCQS